MAKQQEKQLDELFHETLKDIYFAEHKILKTLPKMAKAAQSKELAAAFNKHFRETQGQVFGRHASECLCKLVRCKAVRLSAGADDDDAVMRNAGDSVACLLVIADQCFHAFLDG